VKNDKSAEELLITNSLTLPQIIERLDLIKSLLSSEKIEFTEAQLQKLAKIIDKSNYNSDNGDNEIDKLLKSFTPVSEKYFDNEKLKRLYEKLRASEELEGIQKINIKPKILRSSANFKNLENSIKSETEIKSTGDNSFRLIYPKEKNKDRETQIEFEIKINDNKIEILFSKTYKESNLDKMKPEDGLFPEEIQITMFKKLLESYPTIKEKIKSAKKINCTRDNILNQKSLSLVGKYLQEKIDDPNNLESKKFLESTPNQNNSHNFINQLSEIIGVEIKPSAPPKLKNIEVIGAYSLKQTFKSSEKQQS